MVKSAKRLNLLTIQPTEQDRCAKRGGLQAEIVAGCRRNRKVNGRAPTGSAAAALKTSAAVRSQSSDWSCARAGLSGPSDQALKLIVRRPPRWYPRRGMTTPAQRRTFVPGEDHTFNSGEDHVPL